MRQKAKLITTDHASKSTGMTSKRVSGVEFHFSVRYRRGVYITPAGGTVEVNHGPPIPGRKGTNSNNSCRDNLFFFFFSLFLSISNLDLFWLFLEVAYVSIMDPFEFDAIFDYD